MHVRIAWEIYKNKRKAASGSGGGLDPARGASAGPPLLMASGAQPARGAAPSALDVLGAHQLHSQAASSRHLALGEEATRDGGGEWVRWEEGEVWKKWGIDGRNGE